MNTHDGRDRTHYSLGQPSGRARLVSILRPVVPAVLTVCLVVLVTLWSGALPVSAGLPTNLNLASQLAADDSNSQVLAQAPAPATLETPAPDDFEAREEIYMKKIANFRGSLGALNIFIIFFITLGPLKIIGPFVKMTQHADDSLRRNLAIRGAGLATVVILLVVLLGGNILAKWTVSIASLFIAAGFLLFLSSLQAVMAQYEPARSYAAPPEPSMKLLINPLVFPNILPPYGIALALIIMITNTRIFHRPELVLGMLVLVMVLDLLAMLGARSILKVLNPVALQVVGLVLSVMQLALGLEIILIGLQLEFLILNGLLH